MDIMKDFYSFGPGSIPGGPIIRRTTMNLTEDQIGKVFKIFNDYGVLTEVDKLGPCFQMLTNEGPWVANPKTGLVEFLHGPEFDLVEDPTGIVDEHAN